MPPSAPFTQREVVVISSGFLRAAPNENAAVVKALPAGTRLLSGDITDVRPPTPKALQGWIGIGEGVGPDAGWVTRSNLRVGGASPFPEPPPLPEREPIEPQVGAMAPWVRRWPARYPMMARAPYPMPPPRTFGGYPLSAVGALVGCPTCGLARRV